MESEVGKGAKAPRFVADLTVGKLARWLRVLGFDVLVLSGDATGEILKAARQEGRILLSRSEVLCLRARKLGLHLTSDSVREQIREVAAKFPLASFTRPFTRCSLCNEPLVPVSKASVHDEVPPFVYRTQEEFSRCPSCRKVYWRGTHWLRMKERFSWLLAGEEPECDPGDSRNDLPGTAGEEAGGEREER